ncbi:hypothetical protein THAOC_33610, partial [Thalassiosira oceanica]
MHPGACACRVYGRRLRPAEQPSRWDGAVFPAAFMSETETPESAFVADVPEVA